VRKRRDVLGNALAVDYFLFFCQMILAAEAAAACGKLYMMCKDGVLGHFLGLMKKRHPRRITRRLYFSFDRVGGCSQFQWDSTAAVFSGPVIGKVMCLMALLMLTMRY